MLALVLAVQAPKIDAAAMALLKKSRDATFALRSYRAECRSTTKYFQPGGGDQTRRHRFASLAAGKPTLMRYDMWRPSGSKAILARPQATPDITYASDGRTQWLQFGQSYRTSPDPGPLDMGTQDEPWSGFYATQDSAHERALYAQRRKELVCVLLKGREKIDGAVCDRVEIETKGEYQGMPTRTRSLLFLGPDGLVRRRIKTSVSGDGTSVETADLVRIEKNPDLGRTSFAYVPPEGVVSEDSQEASPPLASGAAAPDFAAKDRDGKTVRLSDHKGKVVVLDFWASWCGPCLNSMPHTQGVADKLRKEGLPVVVLAVDDGEPFGAFAAWVGKVGAAKYPALSFLHSPQADEVSLKRYQVASIPTQYVIDASGTVRASFVGYGGPTDELEKAIRAALEAR